MTEQIKSNKRKKTLEFTNADEAIKHLLNELKIEDEEINNHG